MHPPRVRPRQKRRTGIDQEVAEEARRRIELCAAKSEHVESWSLKDCYFRTRCSDYRLLSEALYQVFCALSRVAHIHPPAEFGQPARVAAVGCRVGRIEGHVRRGREKVGSATGVERIYLDCHSCHRSNR